VTFTDELRETAERGVPDHEQYAAWVEMYSSEEFAELARWCRDLMDDVAEGSTAADRARYRELFLTSSRYEYMFWDGATRRDGTRAVRCQRPRTVRRPVPLAASRPHSFGTTIRGRGRELMICRSTGIVATSV